MDAFKDKLKPAFDGSDKVAEAYSKLETTSDEEFFSLTGEIVNGNILNIGATIKMCHADLLISHITHEVVEELRKAINKFGKFNSAHEGFAVLNEEVDELWDHVKTNQSKRDIQAMRKEAVQIAAMAIRFAVDICNETDGRK